MKKGKTNNGITLIALVVTIIILLILAGITIGIATNGTGLFDKAKEATEKYQSKQVEEEMQLAKYSNEIDSYVGGGRAYLNVKSGTYTGTGESGSEHQNTLTFEEAPQLVIISPTDLVESQSYQSVMFIQGCKYSGINTVSFVNTYDGTVNKLCILNWLNNGKTVSWYSENYYPQMNAINVVYKWVAIF